MRVRVSRMWLEARAHGAAGPLAGLVSSGAFLLTMGGSIREYRASPFELGLPAWFIAAAFVGSLAIVANAWISSLDRPAASVGLAVATVGLLVPVWAGWTTLSADCAGGCARGGTDRRRRRRAGRSALVTEWTRRQAVDRDLRLAVAAVVVHAAGLQSTDRPGMHADLREPSSRCSAASSRRTAATRSPTALIGRGRRRCRASP